MSKHLQIMHIPQPMPFAAFAVLSSLFLAVPALAKPPAHARGIARRFASPPAEMATFGTQFVREISLDMCSWTNRPLSSTCIAQNPADAPSTYKIDSAVVCGTPTEPLPTTSWYDHSASFKCGTPGCDADRWEWSDGRVLRGRSWGPTALHCPTDPSQFGVSPFLSPVMAVNPGHSFVEVPGFFSHIEPQVVRGLVQVGHQSVRPTPRPTDPDYPYGEAPINVTLVLALQVLDWSNRWVDVDTQNIRVTGTYVAPTLYQVQATLEPNSAVRVQLRAGNDLMGPYYPEDTSLRFSHTLWAYIVEARLSLPECVPDEAHPGQCL